MIGMQLKRVLSYQADWRLAMVLMILMLLTIVGVTLVNTSTMESTIADNEKNYKIVQYAAEAGIEAGRAALHMLKNADTGNWDNLLQGKQLAGQATGVTTLDALIDSGGGRNVALATFTLAVSDNDDLDGSAKVDTDNTVILRSTGIYGSAQTQVEAYVRYTGSQDEYVQEHYRSAGSGEVAAESAAASSNRRWSQ
jgi:Tfp pilus assembly protein PilX